MASKVIVKLAAAMQYMYLIVPTLCNASEVETAKAETVEAETIHFSRVEDAGTTSDLFLFQFGAVVNNHAEDKAVQRFKSSRDQMLQEMAPSAFAAMNSTVVTATTKVMKNEEKFKDSTKEKMARAASTTTNMKFHCNTSAYDYGCHSTCVTCGEYNEHVNDCCSCASGSTLTVEYADGTGTCTTNAKCSTISPSVCSAVNKFYDSDKANSTCNGLTCGPTDADTCCMGQSVHMSYQIVS